MPDVQILATQTAASPLDYTVPGSQEILIKSLFASFDGSGSASSFIPAVQVIAPGGHVAGTYLQNGQVAAGGSADASWFPGMNGAGANGIQFDTRNIGDWLDIETTGVQTRGLQDFGGLYVNVAGAASDININSERDQNYEAGNDVNIDTAHDVNVTPAHNFNVDAQNLAQLRGEQNVNVLSGAGMTIACDHDLFLTASGGTTEASVQIAIGAGNYMIVRDVNTAQIWFRSGNTFSQIGMDTGGVFQITNHAGAPILEVDESGTSYRIKAGQAWAATL